MPPPGFLHTHTLTFVNVETNNIGQIFEKYLSASLADTACNCQREFQVFTLHLHWQQATVDGCQFLAKCRNRTNDPPIANSGVSAGEQQQCLCNLIASLLLPRPPI